MQYQSLGQWPLGMMPLAGVYPLPVEATAEAILTASAAPLYKRYVQSDGTITLAAAASMKPRLRFYANALCTVSAEGSIEEFRKGGIALDVHPSVEDPSQDITISSTPEESLTIVVNPTVYPTR